jgi:hypothetical protein
MSISTINNQYHFNLIKDDLFNHIDNLITTNHSLTVLVPHVCNNIDAFGAGFAGAVARKYPLVKDNYHMLGPSFLRKNLGYSQFITIPNQLKNNSRIVFCNMIAQNGIVSRSNKRPINYLALCRCMVSVSKFIKENNNKQDNRIQIHAPKFGSGLAGGNWGFISYLIDDIWDSVDVFVYDNKK